MSTSLIVGVLITIGVIALLVVAALLMNPRRGEAGEEPALLSRPVQSQQLANGTHPSREAALAALEYPRVAAPSEPLISAVQREREQEESRLQEQQKRYEQTLQELMKLLQQSPQTENSASVQERLEEDLDPYRATSYSRRQIDRPAIPSTPQTPVTPASSAVQDQERPGHYALVPTDEQARRHLPDGRAIPVSIELDGNIEPERVPRMRIDVVIHIE